MNIKINTKRIYCRSIHDVLNELPHGKYCIYYYNSRERFNRLNHNRIYIMNKPRMEKFLVNSIFETRIIAFYDMGDIIVKVINEPLYIRIRLLKEAKKYEV